MSSAFLSTEGRCLIEQAFCIDVVAVLHHGVQQFVYAVANGIDRFGLFSCPLLLASCTRVDFYAGLGECLQPVLLEGVFAVDEQGREWAIVVVPAPTPAEWLVFAHREVIDDAARDALYALFLPDILCRFEQFVRSNHGIHTANHDEVALQDATHHLSLRAKLCAKLVISAKTIECRDSRHDLLTRGWSHPLRSIDGIERQPVRQVIYVESELGGLEKRRLTKQIECLLLVGLPSSFWERTNLRHQRTGAHHRFSLRHTFLLASRDRLLHHNNLVRLLIGLIVMVAYRALRGTRCQQKQQ